MRKLLFIFVTLLFMSCSTDIKSPITGIEYKGAIKEEGISITAIPPFWSMCVNFYKYLIN